MVVSKKLTIFAAEFTHGDYPLWSTQNTTQFLRTMRYNTIVDKSEETLNLIIAKAEEFDQERVLNGLSMRHYTLADVQMLRSHVEEYHAKLRKEIVSLVAFAQDFNQQYATDNNKCFDTASQLFNRIRSSIAGTKRLYRKFCPIIRRRRTMADGQVPRPSAFERSTLSVKQLLLFGTEGYEACVDELCEQMEQFFADLVVGLKLCRDVLQQEKEIRRDLPRVLSIYETCCSQVVSESRSMMRTLERCSQVEADEMTCKKSAATSVQQFVSDRFHTLDKSQFQMHAVMDAISKGRRNGLTDLESMLWNNNLEFVQQVRLVIAHLDELEPAGQMNRTTRVCKLSARYVAMLMQWCGITGTGKEKQFVEEYFNHSYQGRYQTLSSSSVNAAKNRFTAKQYEDFCLQLTGIISPGQQQRPKQRVVD